MANQPVICFRVDSSSVIGSGHIMRCLTLADELKKIGADCHFLCRPHQGAIIEAIEQSEHSIHLLAKLNNRIDPLVESDIKRPYEKWLGVNWHEDAIQTINYLDRLNPTLLVVDHYAIDFRWEEKVRQNCRYLMVIDDLADRRHECDLLLDQTFNQELQLYDKLTPSDCTKLIGSQFALLRPEFSMQREYSLRQRQKFELKKILVFMGGGDLFNATRSVIESLSKANLSKECEINVVLSQSSKWFSDIELLANELSLKIHILTGVDNMADLLVNADLAIGAPGSSSWERCTLGVPSILITLAQNQWTVAQKLAEAEAAKVIFDMDKLDVEVVSIVDAFFTNQHSLTKMVKNASQVTDGKGVTRVSNVLAALLAGVSIRQVKTADKDIIFEWQSLPETRKYFSNSDSPQYSEHCEWFSSSLRNSERELYIILYRGTPSGLLRLDESLGVDTVEHEISILISPKFYRLGIAKTALLITKAMWPKRHFFAYVKKENEASNALFQSAGFVFDESRYVLENSYG